MRWPSGSELLERDVELALLREVIASTRAGHGAVVIVEGAAGIGKTRLLEAARGIATEAGVRVTWARASEQERDYGFGVLRQLLESAVTAPDGHLREDLFKGAAALAAPLFQGNHVAHARAIEPDYATLHGLYWLLAELADERPLTVCVDDVQWADPPSLRFLTFAARRIDNLAVTILATRRTGEAGGAPTLVSQLVTETGVLTVTPPALTAVGVAAIVRNELEVEFDADFVDACLQSTGGNPFYLRALLGELARAGGEADTRAVQRITATGSNQISTVLLRRLAAQPAGAREFAWAVAVLGDGAGIGPAASLVGLPPAAADDVLDGLVAAGFLADRDGVAFTHPIVRSSVYASIAARTRSQLHMKAARQLEDDGARVEQIARHLVHGLPGGDPRTVMTLCAAAQRSLAVGAPESAAAFLQRALIEPPPEGDEAAVLLELGRAEMRAGHADAVAHLEQVLGHPAASPAQRGLAALDLGEFFMHTLRGAEAIAVLEAGLAAAAETEPALAKRIEATLIFNAYGHIDVRRQLLDRVRALRPSAGTPSTDPTRLLFAALAYDEVTGTGTASTAIAFAEECISYRGPMHGSTEGTAMALALCGLAAADRPAEAEQHADGMIEIARATGSIVMFAQGSALRALIRGRRGDLAGAEADARAVLSIDSYGGLEVVRPLAVGVVAAALNEAGEFAASRAAIASINREQAARVPTWMFLLEVIVDLRLATGDAERAVAEARHFSYFEEEWGVGGGVGLYEWRWRAAAAHSAAGDQDAARAVASEQLSLARVFGSDRARGIALRTCALLEAAPDRVEMLREGILHLTREDSALERTRALIELGAALRRCGHRGDAREPLQEGLELARRCSALRLAKRAHTELRAAGAHPRTPARRGVDALTPSEQRVAAMAAHGLTNKEAAQALFVTVKTVEMHLSNCYRKLGIGSRRQLQEVLASA